MTITTIHTKTNTLPFAEGPVALDASWKLCTIADPANKLSTVTADSLLPELARTN